MKPKLRPSPLCCVLNARYKCSECGGVVCEACNLVDLANGGGVTFTGHIKSQCIEDIRRFRWDHVGDTNFDLR